MDSRILVLAGTFLGISLGLFFVLMSFVRQFLRTRRKLFVYILLFALAFVLVALIGIRELIPEPFLLLVCFQLLFLLLGIIHAFTMYRHFEWSPQQFLFPELTFTGLVWLTGMIPFLFIYKMVRGGEYLFLVLGASLFFIVPFLFIKTYQAALAVPLPDIKRWFYPSESPPEEPDEALLQQLLVIAFLMPKLTDDRKFTNFRAKAPSGMVMGELFYHFVEDYNSKNPSQAIAYADKYGRAYGWHFYFKPRWYLLYHKRYIDPDLTVAENRIRENSVIVCERRNVDGGELVITADHY